MQEQLCDESHWDFSGPSAVYVNCTLKRSLEISHTRGLGDLSIPIMERLGVQVQTMRAIDLEIATRVYPDTTEHGWERDDCPKSMTSRKYAYVDAYRMPGGSLCMCVS